MSGPASAGGRPPGEHAVSVVREIEITNKKGLHARASAKFVQTAEQFDAAIIVTRGHDDSRFHATSFHSEWHEAGQVKDAAGPYPCARAVNLDSERYRYAIVA